MLKAIMNALKLRWPAFMGTNVLLSVGLFGTATNLNNTYESIELMVYSPTLRLLVLPQAWERGEIGKGEQGEDGR